MLEMRARNAMQLSACLKISQYPILRSFNQYRYPLLTTFWFQTALSAKRRNKKT